MHECREYIKFPVINFNVCIYIIKIEINKKVTQNYHKIILLKTAKKKKTPHFLFSPDGLQVC